MEIKIPRKVLQIVDVFEKSGYKIYIVGGAVRDILMNKAVYDWDMTTNASPEEMLKIFDDAYYTNDFGTVGVPAETEDERPYEITTYRTELGYSDSRRPDKVEWGKTLEEDLKRRDFTINALALKIINQKSSATSHSTITVHVEFIEHFNGKKDIKDKLIRAVGIPNERFSEDALRMLRAVRIATEIGFEIEEETLNAIKKNKKLIHKISAERVRDELLKIMAAKNPHLGVLLLKQTELLGEILPELDKAFGVEQKSPQRHHIYDVGTHSLKSLQFVTERNADPIVRLATLLHDVGKVKTFKKLESGIITFYNHELVGARIAKDVANRLRFSNVQKNKFWTLIRYHQFTVDERQTDSAIRRFIRKVGLENIPDMLDLRVGDRLGGGARETSWRLEEFKKRLVEVQKQPFAIKDLKVSGTEVMEILGIKPGPKVGEILKKLFDLVVAKKLENEHKVLLEKIKEITV